MQNNLTKTKLFSVISLAVLGAIAYSAISNHTTTSQPRILLQSLSKDNMIQEFNQLFSEWKNHHTKFYETIEEEEYRLETFIENYLKILEFNLKNPHTTLALNKFADLSGEEFSSIVSGFTNTPHNKFSKTKLVPFEDSELPASIDWRNQGAVTSVKNQHTCGGCWAFAAAASLEGFNKIKNGNLVSLSPQQLIDCTTTCSGCGGCDNLYNALTYTSTYGIEKDSDYPFVNKAQTCKYQESKVVVKNEGYQNVVPNSASQLKAAITKQPVLVGIEADQMVFQFYKGGVITAGCGNEVDHAVTAVGYGVMNGKEAFIVKNSWGSDWGVDGYVYISTDQSVNNGTGVCGILSSPAFPTGL